MSAYKEYTTLLNERERLKDAMKHTQQQDYLLNSALRTGSYVHGAQEEYEQSLTPEQRKTYNEGQLVSRQLADLLKNNPSLPRPEFMTKHELDMPDGTKKYSFTKTSEGDVLNGGKAVDQIKVGTLVDINPRPKETPEELARKFEESLSPTQRQIYQELLEQEKKFDKDPMNNKPARWESLLGSGVFREGGAGLNSQQVEKFKTAHGGIYAGWLEGNDGSGGWGRWQKPKFDVDPLKEPMLPLTPEPISPGTPAKIYIPKPDLPLQQQQAYLKVLGYEAGSMNDTAKSTAAIEAAKQKFAKDNGIDPNDQVAVQEALRNKTEKSPEALAVLEKAQREMGSQSKADVKIAQWLAYGHGNEMPKSVSKDGKSMDGVVGPETRTNVPKASSTVQLARQIEQSPLLKIDPDIVRKLSDVKFPSLTDADADRFQERSKSSGLDDDQPQKPEREDLAAQLEKLMEGAVGSVGSIKDAPIQKSDQQDASWSQAALKTDTMKMS